VRQLRNIVEQINVIETDERTIDAAKLKLYLPTVDASLVPAVRSGDATDIQGPNEREMLYAVIARLQQDVNALKEHFALIQQSGMPLTAPAAPTYHEGIMLPPSGPAQGSVRIERATHPDEDLHDVDHTEVEETLSIEEKEKELIRKALAKHRNKRKSAAQELGISERTLYRKIKEYNIP
jgi:transcriptional regulator with PAS, ATPase and Fis domain